MKRALTLLTGGLLAISSIQLASAQEGKLKEKLIEALKASADGECPAQLMSPMLQDTCERQMPNLAQALKQRGKITGASFRGTQQGGAGEAEVYRVNFEAGSMTWMISTGTDGKINVLWSGG